MNLQHPLTALAAALCLAAPCLVAPPASAAPPCAGTLTPDQIVACLGPQSDTPRTRGIVIRHGATAGQAPAADAGVNLTVNFAFNSAELTSDGSTALDALGKALTDPSLHNVRFRIAGHTDAVGSDAYNQKLSQERAATVRAYLTSHFQLSPNRFEVVGLGRTQLLDPAAPTDPSNRRVQVTRL